MINNNDKMIPDIYKFIVNRYQDRNLESVSCCQTHMWMATTNAISVSGKALAIGSYQSGEVTCVSFHWGCIRCRHPHMCLTTRNTFQVAILIAIDCKCHTKFLHATSACSWHSQIPLLLSYNTHSSALYAAYTMHLHHRRSSS